MDMFIEQFMNWHDGLGFKSDFQDGNSQMDKNFIRQQKRRFKMCLYSALSDVDVVPSCMFFSSLHLIKSFRRYFSAIIERHFFCFISFSSSIHSKRLAFVPLEFLCIVDRIV